MKGSMQSAQVRAYRRSKRARDVRVQQLTTLNRDKKKCENTASLLLLLLFIMRY